MAAPESRKRYGCARRKRGATRASPTAAVAATYRNVEVGLSAGELSKQSLQVRRSSAPPVTLMLEVSVGGRPAAGATVTVQPARDTSRSRHRAPHSKLPGLRRSPENSFDFECGCLDLSVRGASATQRFACVLLTQLGTGASMESSLWSLRGPQRGQARLQAAADLRARRIDGALARVRHLARPWSRSSRVTRTRNDPQGRREAPRDPRVLDRRALSFEATKLATASARALRAWLRRRP